jgi:hypothetical protein
VVTSWQSWVPLVVIPLLNGLNFKFRSSDSDINELVVSLPKVFSYLRVLQALHGDSVVLVS